MSNWTWLEWASDYCLLPSEQLNLARVSKWLLFNAKWAIELGYSEQVIIVYYQVSNWTWLDWASDYCLLPSEQLNLGRVSEWLLFITKWAIELG